MASSASTRHSPSQSVEPHLQDLFKSLSPTVVALESSFSCYDNRELDHPCRHGAGVFLDPTLIVTSARLVGHVVTSYGSKTAEKPDGGALHESFIASTVALTRDLKMLKTKPLAVNFSNDVAVLKVVGPEEALFPHCSMANFPPRKDDILIVVVHMGNNKFGMMPGNVRAIGEKTFKVKAPWPLNNESGWLEHDSSKFNGGNPPPSSSFC